MIRHEFTGVIAAKSMAQMTQYLIRGRYRPIDHRLFGCLRKGGIPDPGLAASAKAGLL